MGAKVSELRDVVVKREDRKREGVSVREVTVYVEVSGTVMCFIWCFW
jgi:hypothetical protein